MECLLKKFYLAHALSGHSHSLLHLDTGNLEKYKDRNFCWYLGHQDDEMGRCSSPEGFANYFGLLDSVSHNQSKSNSSHSFGYKIADIRYHFHC
jgi:hypothetical protein